MKVATKCQCGKEHFVEEKNVSKDKEALSAKISRLEKELDKKKRECECKK